MVTGSSRGANNTRNSYANHQDKTSRFDRCSRDHASDTNNNTVIIDIMIIIRVMIQLDIPFDEEQNCECCNNTGVKNESVANSVNISETVIPENNRPLN